MCGRKILRPYKMVHPFSAAVPPITCPNCNCRRTRYILQAIGAVFFRRSRLFVLFHPFQHPSLPTSPPQAPAIKIAEKGKSRVCSADFFKISLAHILRICYLCAINCKHTVNRVLQFGCWSGSFALPTITQNLSVRSLKFSTIRHFFVRKF